MDYSELLYDFVDGTTDATQEQSLFTALASHDELRADLKQMMAIKTAVQNDSKAFNPPAESTLALFSTLGFAAPTVTPPVATAKANIASRASEFIGGSSKAIITGLAMSSVTALVMFLLMNNPAENSNGKFTGKATPSAAAAHSNVLAGMSSANAVNNTTETVRTITLPPKEIIKYVYVNVPVETPSVAALAQEIPVSESSDAVAETTDGTAQQIMSTDYRTLALSQNIPIKNSGWKHVDYDADQLPAPIDATPSSNFSRWTFELRRIDTRSSVSPTFVSPTPLLNNLAVTALYSLNSELSAGIEIAAEQSFQSFTGTDKAGRTLLYEQNPTLPSVAATIRYTPFQWGKFQPIFQAGIGGTEVGAFGRGLIGVQYFPETFLSFLISGEANMMRYSYQNTTYTTSKYGLSYGISFHF